MFGPYRLQLDLYRIAHRISPSASQDDAREWLKAHGFTEEAEGWQIQWLRGIADLEVGEILAASSRTGRRFKSGRSFILLAREVKKEFEQIERRNAQLAEAAGPVELHECQVPNPLIGLSKQAVSRFRVITRRAARCGSWDKALADVPMVPIDHAPGNLPFHAFAGPHDWPNVALHAVHDHLATDTRRDNREEWQNLKRLLLLDGIERFWFCLASLEGHWPLILEQAPAELRPAMAQTLVRAFVRWWPQFIRLSPRFVTMADNPFGCPRWGRLPLETCIHLGADNEQISAAMERGPLAAVDFMSACLSRNS